MNIRLSTVSIVIAGVVAASAVGLQAEPARQEVMPARGEVSAAVMSNVYQEVRTPYKYGVILKAEEPGAYVDAPQIFRHAGKWYMMYIQIGRDMTGYETLLAVSDDLLAWKPLGKILPFRKGAWDSIQAAGYFALQDPTWGGSCELGTHDGKYWLCYFGGNRKGYETDPLMIGMAWTTDPSKPQPWTRLEAPVLSPGQPDSRYWEKLTLFQGYILHDKDQSLGFPYVMYYNARSNRQSYERIGMALSRDMRDWTRYGKEPVIDHGRGIAGGAQVVRIGDVWVMFYFGAFWKPKAFDTFACSYDLVHWTKWTGRDLVEPGEPWDQDYAHKPWMVKHDGVVYHYYCAVGNQGRVIALATSRELPRQSPAKAVPSGGAQAQVLKEVDLASDTAWSLSMDGRPGTRPIKVPSGGWNSNRQSPRLSEESDVTDHVVYSRTIQIPAEAKGQVTRLLLGCVNYGAEVSLDGEVVGQHKGPFTAFEVDLTGRVEPLKSYRLDIKAYTLNHYNQAPTRDLAVQGKMKVKEALQQGDINVPTGFVYFDGLTSLGYGIGRYVKLQVLPTLHIKDIFVRPSVSGRSLRYDVWIANRGPAARTVTLKSVLTSWNQDAWPYPQIPDTNLTVAAGQTLQAGLGPVAWPLGPESYWWPNIPFREDYVAKLHLLNLSLQEAGKTVERRTQRFGFVEHAEGPYYYTINGVRVNLASDATAITQCGIYDGYSESPAFKPPTAPNTGCPETWKRHMRLGIRANRTHQELPTEYMMEVADEVGFMLIPESAIRGSFLKQTRNPREPSYATHIAEMIVACRNHPSVARYSLCNEFGAPPEFIGYAAAADPTRPLIYESNSHAVSTRVETPLGHAYTTAHYCTWPRPARQIFAMGEYAWSTDGIADYVNQGRDMRLNDICYFSGWSWLNYWPNFLEGHNHATHAWRSSHPDRRDGVDGWESPVTHHIRKSLDPCLILDHELERIATGLENWPGTAPTIKPGAEVTRTLEVFNDLLFGNRVTLRWSACLDSPHGQEIARGSKDLTIEPGFHATETITFKTPELGPAPERLLYLVLESVKQGKTLFREDRVAFRLSAHPPKVEARFLGEDTATQGDWMSKYGRDGYSVAGALTKLSGATQLTWQQEVSPWTWKKDVPDKRALQYFVNDGSQGFSRLAAKWGRYGPLQFTLDVGDQPRELSLYFLDWSHRNQPQRLSVPEAGIEQTVKDSQQGKYLRFQIRGKVTFILDGGGASEISGVFLDPVAQPPAP